MLTSLVPQNANENRRARFFLKKNLNKLGNCSAPWAWLRLRPKMPAWSTAKAQLEYSADPGSHLMKLKVLRWGMGKKGPIQLPRTNETGTRRSRTLTSYMYDRSRNGPCSILTQSSVTPHLKPCDRRLWSLTPPALRCLSGNLSRTGRTGVLYGLF